MTVLITGATGQLGSLVVKHLLDRIPANDIAVSVRSPEKAADLAAKGIDVRAGDFNDLALMTKAFADIDTALIISAEDDNAMPFSTKNGFQILGSTLVCGSVSVVLIALTPILQSA